FSHAGGEVANRFVVHVNAKIGLGNATGNRVAANVYPNPVSGQEGFTLVMDGLKTTDLRATLHNSLGQQIEIRNLKAVNGKLSQTFSIAKLAQGIYTLSITSGTVKIVKKVVVQ